MRWFASFIITTVLTGIAMLLLWLRDRAPLGLHEISDALRWLIPEPIAFFATKFSPLLIVGCWVVVRVAIFRMLAYTTSETEGSPRKTSALGTSVREIAAHYLSNPARWWLAAFVPMLTFTVAAAGPIVFYFVRDPVVRVMLGLTTIFFLSVSATFARPDRVDPLTPLIEDDPLDPSLVIPGEAA